MKNKELEEAVKARVDILTYSSEVRGIILERVIVLENVINMFLANHFCHKQNDRIIDMLEMVFSTTRITFDGKREIFMGVIQKYYTEFAQKNEGSKGNPGINSRLQDIAKERNIFAHHLLDTSADAVTMFNQTKTITFLKYNNSLVPEPYTLDDVDNLMTKVSVMSKLILGLTVL